MHFPFRLQFLVSFALLVPCCRCQTPIEKHRPPGQRAADALPRVTCASRRIRAVFGPLVRHNLHVKDRTGISVPVPKAKEHCGVRRGSEKNGTLSFLSRYDGCYSQIEGDTVMVSLGVQLTTGEKWYRVNISCPILKKALKPYITPTAPPGQCETHRALRVACGPQNVSGDACFKLGCCYDAQDFTCSYRMNACSLDGHFVFWVRASDADPPLRPGRLAVKDQPLCSPVVTTSDTAVFKVGVTECGTKMKLKGDVISYEVEVEELETDMSSKHSPFSLQVQCQYEASGVQRRKDHRSLSPTNLPPVTALGSVTVQMRLATDESFTSFLSGDQLPLSVSLRKPVYVEVSIAPPSPDPSLSLRVRDCFAYPASRHSVWTLLYDGCPNPLDNMRSSIPKNSLGRTTSHSQVRRFNVKTFAFLDPKTGQPSVEEMYFYCWVEICTEDVECAQRCSIYLSDEERRRRDSDAQQVQLVSFGPLLFGQNRTGQEGQPGSQLGAGVFIQTHSEAGEGSMDDPSQQEESMDDHSQQEGSRNDPSQQEGSMDDPSQQEESMDDRSQPEGSRNDPSQQEGSMDDPSQQEGSRDDPRQQEGSMDDPSQQEGSRDDPSQQEGSRDDPSQQEGSMDDPSQQEGSMDDPSQQEGSRDDPSQQEGSMDDPSQQEGSMDDPSQQEGSRDDPSQQEGSRDDPSQQEGSRDDPSQQAEQHN